MQKLIIFLFLFTHIVLNTSGQNRINLSVGQKIHTENSTLSKTTQHVMDQEIVMNTSSKNSYEFSTVAIKPLIQMNCLISKMKFRNEAMGNIIEFDSEKKEDIDGQFGSIATQVLGKSFELFFNENGSVSKSDKNDLSLELLKQLAAGLEEIGSEIFLALPSTLKEGDSWIEELKENEDNSKKMDFHIVSKNGTFADIRFAGKSSIKVTKTVQGAEAKITTTNTYNGDMTIDIVTGIIKVKKTELVSSGVTEVMGQSVKFTLQQTSTSNNTFN